MLSSLVRWFGRGTGRGRSGRAARSARRFTPGLEALEDRAVPSGVGSGDSSAALLGAEVGGPSDVSLFRIGSGSKPGGAGEGVSSAPLLGGYRPGSDTVTAIGGHGGNADAGVTPLEGSRGSTVNGPDDFAALDGILSGFAITPALNRIGEEVPA